MSLLAPLTNIEPKGVLRSLNISHMEMTKPLEEFIARTSTDQKYVLGAITWASATGFTALMKILTQSVILRDSMRELLTITANLKEFSPAQLLLQAAVTADSKDTCASIMSFTGCSPTDEVVNLARQRGRRDVMELFSPEENYEDKITAAKVELKQNILQHKLGFLKSLPASKEFRYNDEMEKLKPLLQYETHLPYVSLLKALHLPKAHTETECPYDCLQPDKCARCFIW